MTAVERALLRAYERIAAELVDATGREQPNGPRLRLTDAQRRSWKRLRWIVIERELAAGRPRKRRPASAA
jgi:hypothetical protein